MKIAHVVSTYPPYKGGMGRVAFEYTERLRDRGHSVHVYTPRYRAAPSDPDYVHRVPSPVSIGNAGVVPSLYKRLSGFDVIHLHYPFFGGAEPVIVRKAIRKNQGLVLTYHMDAVAGGMKGAVFGMHRKLLFPWIISRADRVLVSSQGYAENSALKDQEGVKDKLEIHPFGVDLERFKPGEASDIRKRHGIPDDAIVLLFVGGLDPAHHFKGLHVLLEALETFPDKHWHALIVGGGSLRPSFEAMVQQSALASQVHFAGGVSDTDLPRYFRAANFHVFPSTEKAEAFGLVALEAAASGIPSIASDLPGVSSVVLDGETGLLTPARDVKALAERISLLVRDDQLRKRLGFSARKRAEADFAWDPLISRLEHTYEDVLKSL